MKRTMKKILVRLLVMGIAVGMVVELGTVELNPWLIETKAADYTAYSNAKKSWFVKRNT